MIELPPRRDWSRLPARPQDALREGLPFYYTGKPCRTGHPAVPRFTARKQCVLCAYESDRARADRNLRSMMEQTGQSGPDHIEPEGDVPHATSHAESELRRVHIRSEPGIEIVISSGPA